MRQDDGRRLRADELKAVRRAMIDTDLCQRVVSARVNHHPSVVGQIAEKQQPLHEVLE